MGGWRGEGNCRDGVVRLDKGRGFGLEEEAARGGCALQYIRGQRTHVWILCMDVCTCSFREDLQGENFACSRVSVHTYIWK